MYDAFMSTNKNTVERYIDGFNKGDHAQIISCFTDDAVWEVYGFFRYEGKEVFEQIQNDAFEEHPVITVKHMVEGDDVVIVEGSVVGQSPDAKPIIFCDVFEMRDGKIAKLIGYIPSMK